MPRRTTKTAKPSKPAKGSDDPVDAAIEALRQGRFVFVYDAEGREEETDFFLAAEVARPEHVRQMRKEGGGLIFLMVGNGVAAKVGLPFMVDIQMLAAAKYDILQAFVPDDIPYDTKSSFSVAINHRRTFTGITDRDRALTISEFGHLAKLVEGMGRTEALEVFGRSFRSPGHVPICVASEHPLRERFGHTELSVGLMMMAGLTPVTVGCEMMDDSGGSRPKDSARRYAEEHGAPFLEGKQIVRRFREWSG
jgi:3,4-dihydroxy 2-butanone 4-phosphate synthase